MDLQELLEGGPGYLGAPSAPREVESVVGPWQYDEAMGHAKRSQPSCQQPGLPGWHYLVVTPVDEEGRRIAGVDVGDGGE